MATIAGAFMVPHSPFFPWRVETEGPGCETARLMAAVKQRFDAAAADCVVIFDTDHLNTFFFDHLPIFAVGVTDGFRGPTDEPRGGMAVRDYASNPELAAYIRRQTIDAGFDVSLASEFEVDHSIGVPLHFMTPQATTPVIPIFVNGHIPPLPKARRCFDLGRAVRAAIESWQERLRVAVIGTGSISLDVWGPQIKRGTSDGVPAPEWVTEVCGLLERGDTETLIQRATEDRMFAAGSAGGELLNVIAMLGAIGAAKPDFLEAEMPHGHAYGTWKGN